jgi:hypothetical protein
MRSIILALMVGWTLATPALAQGSATKAAYDAAFQDTLNKPTDPRVLVRFAELAVQMGDLKGAIAALERLLLIDPGQSRVQLELAALYLQIGVPSAAKAYAESVLASPRATPEIRERAHALLAQAESGMARSKFSGDFLFGLQYSSNANSGAAGLIQSGGVPALPSPGVSSTPDWAVVSGGTLHHRYDLQTADHAAVESDLALYGSRQFTVSLANVFLVDLTTGPRFGLLQDSVDGLSARPFVTGRYVSQHDLPTYWAYGTGVELRKDLGAATRGTATLLGRRRDFQNNADVPNNTASSGNELYGVLGFESQLAPWMALRFGGSGTRFIATVPSESYREVGTGFTATFAFADPIGLNGLPWTVTVGGSLTFGAYDAADATVDPGTVRTQRDLVGTLIAAIPLDERLSLIAQATYTDRAASLPNYTYNAATAMIGVGWRF